MATGTTTGNVCTPKRSRRRISLRFVVSTGAVLLIAATVFAMGIVEDRSIRRLLTTEIQNRLFLEARNLAMLSADALLSGDYPELVLQPVVSEMLEESPELAFVYVTDHQNKVRGHPDSRRLGGPLELPPDLAPVEVEAATRPGEELRANQQFLVASAPAAAHGRVVIGLDQDYLTSRIAAARRDKATTVLALLAGGIAGALALMTVLMRPLRRVRAGLERIGRGDLDSPIALRDWTELGQLAETVDDMAARLKEAQAELVDKERLLVEMELARRIQRSLLPSGDQTSGSFKIHGAQRSAAEVGGDYYDVFTLPNERVGLVIADVSGKGLAGCLATSMLAAYVRVYRAQFDSPAAMLRAVETQLEATLTRGTFVTMFYGILDVPTGRLTFASAGHSPTIIYRAGPGALEQLNPRGGPLALARRKRRPQRRDDETVQLEPGDIVVQYTDGVNEAWDTRGERQFGFDNLEKVILEHARSGADVVLERVQDAVAEWGKDMPPSDDETLLLVGVDREAVFSEAVEAPAPRIAYDDEEHDLVPMVREARARGESLSIPVDMGALPVIRDWTQQCPVIRKLGRAQINVVNLLLHEVCGNIIEHGGWPEDETRDITVYWLPDADVGVCGDADLDERTAASAMTRGCFVIADFGTSFDPSAWKPEDAASNGRRGRGLGLPIIHSVTSRICHEAGTEFGNLTLLLFEPSEVLLTGGSRS